MSLHGKRSGSPSAVVNRGARRRAREVVDVEPIGIDALYARDAGYCHLCRLFVPREQASREHVIPLSKGGKDTPENTKLSHLRCNTKKGARVGPKKKGLRRKGFKRKVTSRMTDNGKRVNERDDIF